MLSSSHRICILLQTLFMLLLMWDSRIKFLRVLSNTLLQSFFTFKCNSVNTCWNTVDDWQANEWYKEQKKANFILFGTLQCVRLQLKSICCFRDYVLTPSNLWAKLNWYHSVWRHLKKVSIVDTGIYIGQFSQWTWSNCINWCSKYWKTPSQKS